MKLYELPRNTWFTVDGVTLLLHRLDGLYSYCTDKDGNVHHIHAGSKVQPAQHEEQWHKSLAHEPDTLLK